jgi:hypothetical protein
MFCPSQPPGIREVPSSAEVICRRSSVLTSSVASRNAGGASPLRVADLGLQQVVQVAFGGATETSRSGCSRLTMLCEPACLIRSIAISVAAAPEKALDALC